METFEEFKNNILSAVDKCPKCWRKGQAVFNIVDERYGVARDVQSKDGVDCFFDDDDIAQFIILSYARYKDSTHSNLNDNIKTCIEYMALGHMNIDDACSFCECDKSAFETEEAVEYKEKYEQEFNDFCNGKGTRELHFFANLCDDDACTEEDLETMHVDFVSTRDAISEKTEQVIKTTQLSFLRDAMMYRKEYGWRVFIHYSGKVVEVKEDMDVTDKELKYAHDISRIFIGGGFGEIR